MGVKMILTNMVVVVVVATEIRNNTQRFVGGSTLKLQAK